MSSLPKNRILISIYYDDSASYFLKIESYLKSPNTEITYLCHNLSAYLKIVLNSQSRAFLSNNILLRLAVKKNSFFLKFHEQQFPPFYQNNRMKNAERRELYSEMLEIRKFIERIYCDIDPNLLILTGEDRFAEYFLSNKSAKKLYFEQGPFNTTTLNPSGVNANAAFRQEIYDFNARNSGFTKLFFADGKKERRNGAYRVLDFFYSFISRMFFLSLSQDKGAFAMLYTKIVNRFAPKRQCDNLRNYEYILVALQVEDDANNKVHTPAFDLYDLLDELSKRISEKTRIVIRVHPKEYKRINNIHVRMAKKRRLEVSDKTLRSDLANASLLITSNSTVGIEALKLGLPVFCYGRSYWEEFDGVYAITSKEKAVTEICSLLTRNRMDESSLELRKKHLSLEMSGRFLPGHYQRNDAPIILISRYIQESLDGR